MKLLKTISITLLAITITVTLGLEAFNNTTPTSSTRSVPAVAPVRHGLGVTRDSIVNMFTEPSLGFTFKETQTLGDASQRVLGLSKNSQVLLELIGPASELTEASITAEITGGARNATMNGMMIAGLLRRIFPRWRGSTNWLTDAMKRAEDEHTTSTTTRNEIPIKFQYHTSLEVIIVTVNYWTPPCHPSTASPDPCV